MASATRQGAAWCHAWVGSGDRWAMHGEHLPLNLPGYVWKSCHTPPKALDGSGGPGTTPISLTLNGGQLSMPWERAEPPCPEHGCALGVPVLPVIMPAGC